MGGEFTDVILEDLAAPTRNAIVGGPFGSDLVSADYVPEGVPVVRGENLSSGRWVAGPYAYVTREKADSLAANTAGPLDIIFTQRGANHFRQVALMPPDATERFVISQSQMKITIDPTKADPIYVYYLFRAPEQQEYLQRNAIQTGVPHTNLSILRRVPLRLPSLHRQRRVSQILGALDSKIELIERRKKTLESIARALFKSWFVDFDPVRAKAEGRETGLPAEIAELFTDGFEESEVGEIPWGWRTGTLGDIAIHPRASVKPEEISSEAAYIALEHMPQRSVSLGDWGQAEGIESNKHEFHRGDILFGKLRPYFHKVGVAPIDGVCSTDIVVVRPSAPHWFALVLGHASGDAFVNYTNSGSTGTKMPRTSWNEMARYPIAVPPAEVSEALSSHVRPVVDRIIGAAHESRALRSLRDAVLPGLLSGAYSTAASQ